MKEYKIVIGIDNIETPAFCVDAENWEEVVNYVFANIDIYPVDTEENEE